MNTSATAGQIFFRNFTLIGGWGSLKSFEKPQVLLKAEKIIAIYKITFVRLTNEHLVVCCIVFADYSTRQKLIMYQQQ